MTNVSGLNFTIQTGMNPTIRQEITREDILAWCGAGDQQALYFAIAGFILALLAIIYFGGIRGKRSVRQRLLEAGMAQLVGFLDTFLLSMSALAFAAIIMRLLRGGL